MALTDLERVRLKIADKSEITREIDEGDGIAKYIKLQHENVANLSIWKNDVLQVLTTDYTVDLTGGIVVFNSAPAVNDDLVFQYYWTLFSDIEVQDFLDEAGGVVNIAAARLLLALSANASLLAKRSTLAGGSGLGSVTEDTSVAARELRNAAKALIELEGQIGQEIPAEGLTEIPWTEQMYQEMIGQDIIRNGG